LLFSIRQHCRTTAFNSNRDQSTHTRQMNFPRFRAIQM
jgi:hypothetical protein